MNAIAGYLFLAGGLAVVGLIIWVKVHSASGSTNAAVKSVAEDIKATVKSEIAKIKPS